MLAGVDHSRNHLYRYKRSFEWSHFRAYLFNFVELKITENLKRLLCLSCWDPQAWEARLSNLSNSRKIHSPVSHGCFRWCYATIRSQHLTAKWHNPSPKRETPVNDSSSPESPESQTIVITRLELYA